MRLEEHRGGWIKLGTLECHQRLGTIQIDGRLTRCDHREIRGARGPDENVCCRRHLAHTQEISKWPAIGVGARIEQRSSLAFFTYFECEKSINLGNAIEQVQVAIETQSIQQKAGGLVGK